jgi:hypothetical protein
VLLDCVVIARLDSGRLVLHAKGLASHFFAVGPSSVGLGAYDSLAAVDAPKRQARERLTW